MHITLITYSKAVIQQKSKSTQHFVKMIQHAGLWYNIVAGRSEMPLEFFF